MLTGRLNVNTFVLHHSFRGFVYWFPRSQGTTAHYWIVTG